MLQKPSSYIPSLDGVRCLAVFLVLALHGSYGIARGGWIGVDLFFVLSGYLITSLLLKEYKNTGKIDFAKFYVRRALRLFPPLILGITLANLLWASTRHYPNCQQADALVATLASLFYVANLVQPYLLGALGHMWSLSVEEHFYLVWPVLASTVFLRIRFRRCVGWLLAILIVIEVARGTGALIDKQRIASHAMFVIDAYRFTLYRMDAILMGVLLAFLFSRKDWKDVAVLRSPLLLGIVFCLLLAILCLVDDGNSRWREGGFVATNLLCVLLVAIAVKNPEHALLSNGALCWIGRRSYGIYVYHLPIFFALELLRKEHSALNFLLVSVLRFAATFLVAEVSFRYVEQPILRLKRRFEVIPVAG